MRKLPLILLLAIVAAASVASQSGRRTTTASSPTPAPPIQPPLTPPPEIKTTNPTPLTNLMFLPEATWKREIKGLDNKSFRLADFRGKVLVINLWAWWCGPCRREVPDYEKVHQDFLNSDVVFIGLTEEDPHAANERSQRFVRDVNFRFRLGWADGELARTLTDGRQTIPQTLVINQEGRIVSHWEGYSPGHSGPRLKQTIEQALAHE